MISIASFETPFMCSSVELSPFDERKLAVVTSEHFGVTGGGQIHILELDPVGNDKLNEMASFSTSSGGLLDCSWNEVNQNQIITASTDGSVSLWDINGSDNQALCRWMEHKQEVVSVDWNIIEKDSFLSASLDGTIRLWKAESYDSITTFSTKEVALGNVVWSPHHPEVFATSLVDGTVRLWDTQQSRSSAIVMAHVDEALTVDFDKFSEYIVASAGGDRTIRTWDLRFPNAPVNVLIGHSYSVKRIKCHPHIQGVIGSVAHDSTACIWDAKPLAGLTQTEDQESEVEENQQTVNQSSSSPPLESRLSSNEVNYGGRGENGGQLMGSAQHGDFATGFDFSFFSADRLATCGWDKRVCLWDIPLGQLTDKR